MAVPGEVQIGRISRFVSKWLGSKGYSPRLTFGSEITPVIPLWSGVENRWLDSWNRYSAFYNVPAVAAQQGAARLRNPTGSGVIAVLEQINYVPSGVADAVNLNLGATQVDLTVGTGNALDGRNPAQSSLIVSQSGTGAAFLQSIGRLAGVGNASTQWMLTVDHEIPILPGIGFQVLGQTVNAQFFVTFVWRERALEDSEKQ